MANSARPTNHSSFRQALDRARNCDNDAVDEETSQILEGAIRDLWTRIQNEPDSYVLNGDEFALFNYFRDRYRDSQVARAAVARFWDNYHGHGPGRDGSKT
ncbi:uncharacterized protein ACLA_026690 [Aspergillus clavatus NRRL 1]|uniref:Uncharacterized protein n=1 Tax=Aspergillus clavatus (strain ATCC 1007 / CBS 513.65 / DSM 816 / NCTC 3887 / NRRL 1 / QM 1276 / 107) TaxID=344612 RepID=A1CQN1_ASPCL|nr:uncharacterized protein ACLA_026690 [Aspergillus clavatus NRRL 1]EAW07952.1 conserved hypothetical protein [Aspergillus clavatus NRRL 1]